MSENTSSRLEYSIGYNPYLSLSLSKHKDSFSASTDIRVLYYLFIYFLFLFYYFLLF